MILTVQQRETVIAALNRWVRSPECMDARHADKLDARGISALTREIEDARAVSVRHPQVIAMSVLDISTGHLSPETVTILDKHASKWPVAGWSGVHGWIIYAHDERPDDCPDDLWRCIEYARAHGAGYVRFDSDADRVDDLPWHEW